MVANVLYIRPPQGGLSYEEWRDDAACKGLPPYWFELQDFKESRRGEQHKPIAEGLKVCSGCPVRAACKNDSNELDRYWTTRGGQPPEGLFEDSVMPKPQPTFRLNNGGFQPGNRLASREPKKKCKRGHDDWVTRNDGKRRCLTCEQERAKARWSGEK